MWESVLSWENNADPIERRTEGNLCKETSDAGEKKTQHYEKAYTMEEMAVAKKATMEYKMSE